MLGAGALGTWLAVPGLVRDEAIARIERRTGLRCAITEVDAGATGTVLRGISLSDGAGGVSIRLDEVELDAGAFALASGGSAAIEAIVVRGGSVEIDLARYRRPEDGPEPAEASGGARVWPALSVEGLRGAVRDEHGELIAAAASIDPDLLASLLEYQPHRGSERHRAVMARWAGLRGVTATPDEIVVTGGAQHSLLAALATLARPGDSVLT